MLPGQIQNYSLLLFRLFVSFDYFCPGGLHGVDLVLRVGHTILVGTSVPSSLAHPNGALAGLIVSIIVMGIGAGSIKANVSPMIAEQYTGKLKKKTLPSGEVVIISPVLAYQRIYMCKFPEQTPLLSSGGVTNCNTDYYAAINVGACGAISSSFIARDYGFWATYLVPAGIFCPVPLVLLYGRKRYNITPPRGSIILEVGITYRPRTMSTNFSHTTIVLPRPRSCWP